VLFECAVTVQIQLRSEDKGWKG